MRGPIIRRRYSLVSRGVLPHDVFRLGLLHLVGIVSSLLPVGGGDCPVLICLGARWIYFFALWLFLQLFSGYVVIGGVVIPQLE